MNILSAVRGFAQNRVIALFGCGGDRDPKKRPLMGEEGVRQTIETLREGLPEGTSFAGGQIAIGETAYEGFQCILDGQLVTGLFAEGEAATYSVFFRGVDSDSVVRVMTSAVFA